MLKIEICRGDPMWSLCKTMMRVKHHYKTMNSTSVRMGICLLLFSLLVSGQAWAQKAEVPRTQEGVLRVFLLEGRPLQITRQRIRNGDKSFVQALAKLESDAHKALAVEKLSVTVKEALPPGGHLISGRTRKPRMGCLTYDAMVSAIPKLTNIRTIKIWTG
jgi:hypothetical protein